MRFQYTGPGPIEILSGGELIRPGDVREFDAEPDWGPWECIDPAPEAEAEATAAAPEPEKPSLPLGSPPDAPSVSFAPKGM